MPDIIIELARVTAEAKALKDRGRYSNITITVEEAQELLALWQGQQDDGK